MLVDTVSLHPPKPTNKAPAVSPLDGAAEALRRYAALPKATEECQLGQTYEISVLPQSWPGIAGRVGFFFETGSLSMFLAVPEPTRHRGTLFLPTLQGRVAASRQPGDFLKISSQGVSE